jgi:hypothetical protein
MLMKEGHMLILLDTGPILNLYPAPALPEYLIWAKELQGYLFVTTQVRDEVLRNKRSSLIKTLDSLRSPELTIDKIASRFPRELAQEIEADLRSLEGKHRALCAKISDAKSKTIDQILNSKDRVSLFLEELWKQAKEPSPEEIGAARLRRERGNPPGKAKDPLGDQLTWEQFLSELRDKQPENAIIITGDGDYVDPVGSDLLLNPLLAVDAATASAKTTMFVHDSLGDGLQHAYQLLKMNPKQPRPSEEELQNARTIEKYRTESNGISMAQALYLTIAYERGSFLDLNMAITHAEYFLRQANTEEARANATKQLVAAKKRKIELQRKVAALEAAYVAEGGDSALPPGWRQPLGLYETERFGRLY